MSIEQTGSTSGWDDYRKRVITVHDWLIEKIESMGIRTATTQVGYLGNIPIEHTLEEWVLSQFIGQLWMGNGYVEDEDLNDPPILVVVDSQKMEIRLHKGVLTDPNDVAIAIAAPEPNTCEVQVTPTFWNYRSQLSNVRSDLLEVLYNLDPEDGSNTMSKRIKVLALDGFIPRSVFDAEEREALCMKLTSLTQVEAILECNVGWELKAKGTLQKALNYWRKDVCEEHRWLPNDEKLEVLLYAVNHLFLDEPHAAFSETINILKGGYV